MKDEQNADKSITMNVTDGQYLKHSIILYIKVQWVLKLDYANKSQY